MDPGYWWAPMFGISWIFPILCFVFVVTMIYFVFHRASGCCMPMHHGPAKPRIDARETPRQILDRRLASGEITNQDYDETRRRIESQCIEFTGVPYSPTL